MGRRVGLVMAGIVIAGVIGVCLQMRATDGAGGGRPDTIAIPVGPHLGPLTRLGELEAEVLARDSTLTLYLYEADMTPIDVTTTLARMTIRDAGYRYTLDLRRVGDHLQATSAVSLPKAFEADVQLTYQGRPITGHLTREIARAAFSDERGILGPDRHDESHLPRYGGVVMVTGDYQFEVVLDRAGRHRVYGGDEFRGWLPGATFSGFLRVVRQDTVVEELVLTPVDDCLVAEGGPVTGAAVARLEIDLEGYRTYTVDVPFPASGETSTPEPASM